MIEIYISYFANQPIVCLAVFITLVPLVLILYRKAYIDPIFSLLFIYLFIKFGVDLLMLHYATLRKNNIIYYNISIPVFYSILSLIFYKKLSFSHFRKWIPGTIIVFIIFSFWDILNSNPDLSKLHDHRVVFFSKTLECLLMITWILLYFYEIIKTLKIPNLLTFPFFWVCSGLLLYYSSIIFISPVLYYTATWINRLDIGFLYDVPLIFEIICSLSFCIGIWVFSAKYYAQQ
jgi:hypothetical protein